MLKKTPEGTPEDVKRYAQEAKASVDAGNGMPPYKLGDTLTAWAQSFGGMSLADFDQWATEASQRPTTKGIPFKDSFFKPMLEVVQYLQKHQFTV